MSKKDVYLVPVPLNQIKWFDSMYGFINDDDYQTDGASWSMLKNNIQGKNDRFLNYDGNSNNLLEGFYLGYSSGCNSKINTNFFLNTCLEAINKAVKLEFYEIAFNIKTIYMSIIKNIHENELFFNDVFVDRQI